MKRLLVCLLLLMLLVLPVTGSAAIRIAEPGEDFYYLDTANVLSVETEGEIYFANRLLEEQCGAQIVIAAVESIGDADIYDYAVEMGNSWGIGSAEENNGFLLVMAIEEENYYALAGRGLQKIFPASELKKLYDKYLEVDFAAGNYDVGARKFFEAVFEKIADFYNADVSIADAVAAYESYESVPNRSNFGGAKGGMSNSIQVHYDRNERDDDSPGLISSIITFIVLISILRAVFGGRRRGGSSWILPFLFMNSRNHHHHHSSHRGPRPPRNGGFGGGFGGGGGFSGGGFGGGRAGGGGGFGGGAGRGRH